MGITLPAGLEIIYNKQIRMYDISVFCRVGKNPRFFPRSKKYTLREITYLFAIAYAWSHFTDEKKGEWGLAANITGQHGYNLYVQDKSYRIKHGIGSDAVPSIYHQYLVGHLNVPEPSPEVDYKLLLETGDGILLETGDSVLLDYSIQDFPVKALITQYNSRRVNFPASFEINFKTSLESVGENPHARLRFIWTRYYMGQNIESTEIIDLPLVSGWDRRKKWITEHKGIRGRWRIELELKDVKGDIWFDNLWAFYSGEIKINDAYCLDVVRWWKGVTLREGVTFETIYPIGAAI